MKKHKWNFIKKLSCVSLSIISLSIYSSGYAETLRDALEKAVQSNPKILAAEQNRLSIDQIVNQAKANYYPQVKATAAWGPEWSRNSNTIASVLAGGPAAVTMPVRQVGLTLDQMVFDGYATKGEVARNRARANSAAYSVLTTVQDTAMSAVEAYFDVLREQELVELARKNLSDYIHGMHSIQLRSQEGVGNNADLIQAQGQIALAESNLLAERSNLQDAMARYRLVVGDFPEKLRHPVPIPRFAIPSSEISALDFAVKHNPNIKASEADIQMAYEQKQVAKAKNWPRLDLQAGLDRNRNVGGTRGPDFDEFIFARVTYDIFTGGSITGRQRETAHELQQAHEIRNNAYRQVLQQTKFAWDSLITAQKLLPFLNRHVEAAESTGISYGKQFEIGKRNLLDVLNVRTEYFAAGRAKIEGKYKILLSQYQLLHAMGNLVQVLQLPIPAETSQYHLS